MITASEAAAVFGVSPFQNVCTLFDAHTKGKKMFVHAAMIRGTALEPRAVADYSASAGLGVESVGLFVHPAHSWLGASPDGRIAGRESALLEIKIPNRPSTDVTIPQHYLVQMLVQLECAGAEEVCAHRFER